MISELWERLNYKAIKWSRHHLPMWLFWLVWGTWGIDPGTKCDICHKEFSWFDLHIKGRITGWRLSGPTMHKRCRKPEHKPYKWNG